MVTAPVNIRFPPGSITDVSFVVQWDAVINQSVDRYIVSMYWTGYRDPIQSVTVNETSYTVTGLTPNTTYTVTIATVNESNCIGIASAGEEVRTEESDRTSTVGVFYSINPTVKTIFTTDVSRSPSTGYTVTTDNSVTNVIEVTVDSGTKVIPTVSVFIMPTNSVGTTGKLIIR